MQTEQWVPVASAAEVTTTPRPVEVGGRSFVAVRLRDDAPARLFAEHCPHRLVPLSAARVVDGRLQCRYHGWQYGDDGRCAVLPSLGEDANIPPRANLGDLPRVEERAGQLWVCLADLAHADPAPAEPAAGETVLTNEDGALRRAWHPVALSTEVGDEPAAALLLGEQWQLRREGGAVVAQPAPFGVTERWGVVWLAPEPPLTELFADPDVEDAEYVGAWLPPARTTVHAGFVADNFLDVAHFPFVHAGTFGAGEEWEVQPYDVQLEPDGFRSVQDQWFDNPEDPGVAAGLRPVRQRRRATYVYRAPFQLLLRLEELDAGAVKTILFFSQPETLTSTRIYTKLLLHGIGGDERPGPETVAREVAFEEAVLAEDLDLQAVMSQAGLPLDLRTELHVRADRCGVALRRELRRFLERAAEPAAATTPA
jgi:phenylpropionate dioxygenase-like ring-hydroxylating dioxygenase large terminal subunit